MKIPAFAGMTVGEESVEIPTFVGMTSECVIPDGAKRRSGIYPVVICPNPTPHT